MAIRGWENFAHIDEGVTNLQPCKIAGTIPKDLHGVFYRNGPGMSVVYGEPLKHYIDGDGLVVALRFGAAIGATASSNVGASPPLLTAKFVKTWTHQVEREKRRLIFPGQMGTKPVGWQQQVDEAIAKGDRKRIQELFVWRDMAHTNCIYWGGKLLACHEYTFPHLLDPVSLETIEKFGMNGLFDETRSLCAHFRLDRQQNRIVMVGFRNSPKKSAVEIVELSPNWELKAKFSGFVPGLNYVHDLLVTPNFYILQMTPFVKISQELTMQIITGKGSVGEQMLLYKENGNGRIVVIERNRGSKSGKMLKALSSLKPSRKDFSPTASPYPSASSIEVSGHQIGIFSDIEPCHIYHFGHVYENGYNLHFNACCMPPNFSMYSKDRLFLSNCDEAPGELWDYVIDMQKGTLNRIKTPIITSSKTNGKKEKTAFSGEFPTVHPHFHVDKPARYTFMMGTENKNPARGGNLPFRHILRSDRVTGEAKVWRPYSNYTQGEIADLIDETTVVGEAVYLTKKGQYTLRNRDENEEDGYILFQYYTPKHHGKNGFIVANVRTMETICVLQYDVHIPYSFHGIWVPIEMLNEHSLLPSAGLQKSKI